nr:zinc finger, CCHC-type [Tanacetum cinerariifolium]
MSPDTKLGDHIDEFNKLILDLANIDIEIEDEIRHLCYLRRCHRLTKTVETLLYGRESLTMEDVLTTLNSRELKKRTEGTKEELVAEGHMKRDCPRKKSSGFVKKGKRNQDFDSSNDVGSTYFGEALVVVGNDEITELVIDSGGSYHMTHRRDLLYDFKVVDGGSVQLGDNRTCTIKGTWKVKIQLHDGSSIILEDVLYVPGLRRSLISFGKRNVCILWKQTFGVQKYGGSKQVGLKQLGSKQVGFKQLGHKQVGFKQLGPRVKTGVHGVQDGKRVWFKVELQGDQRDREADVFQEKEKVHLGIKVWANIMVTGVHGQEGAEGNVAEKKKVNKFMKANLGKLLKYNAWSTRWSSVRGSSMRKRC